MSTLEVLEFCTIADIERISRRSGTLERKIVSNLLITNIMASGNPPAGDSLGGMGGFDFSALHNVLNVSDPLTFWQQTVLKKNDKSKSIIYSITAQLPNRGKRAERGGGLHVSFDSAFYTSIRS